MPSLSQFERLAVPHMDAAFNLAFWLVRSRADAEDIVQEAYLRGYRSFEGFRGGDIKPWLFTIVRNTAYRWLSDRRRSRTIVSLDEAFTGTIEDGAERQVADTAPTAEERLLGSADRDYLRRALEELPPAFREVLVLREIEELSYSGIAEVTGAPIGTVMSRLSRGRAELRKAWTRLHREDEPDAL